MKRPPVPLTKAELTHCLETSTHADVLEFLRVLATKTDKIRIESIGASAEGRDIASVIVSPARVFTPEAADKRGLLKILVIANIHAGEVEGKEACQMLARDLTLGAPPAWLKKCVIVIIPDYNPDGNDRIDKKNRVLDLEKLDGQVGPEGGVGTRYTGAGINLNRDYMKQEAVESVLLSKAFGRWKPHLTIDCHTTDGSIHGYDLTWDTSHTVESGPRGPILYARDTMLPEIGRRLFRKHKFRTFFYGNYRNQDDPTLGWETYSPLPRYGSHYRGLTGRMDVLLEAYSYIPFDRRIDVMYATLLELFTYAAQNAATIKSIVDRAETETIARGLAPSPFDLVGINYGVSHPAPDGQVSMTYPAHAFPNPVSIESWDRATLKSRRIEKGKRAKYRALFYGRFAPTRSVRRPFAYVVPESVIPRLQDHNIRVVRLAAPLSAPVERYLVLDLKKTQSPDVGTHTMRETVLWTRSETSPRSLPAGTAIVPMAQPLAHVAAYLLEPESDDGFARWGLLETEPAPGSEYPVARINAPVEIRSQRTPDSSRR
ncbi:MAG TPA: M14 family metallopeptidase [Planctomycetota bacterium]|nr:M14 family metallopeptidase [Planctomycetota bacterium]